jgi:hypothetical protein
MKFNAVIGIWSIALVLLTFQVFMLGYDWEFTNTLAYKFMLLVDGFMFGLVVFDWTTHD